MENGNVWGKLLLYVTRGIVVGFFLLFFILAPLLWLLQEWLFQ